MPPNHRLNQPEILTVHTSLLFDPIRRAFLENVSVEVNTKTGAITHLYQRRAPDLPSPLTKRDIDLRGKVVLPGFVDSHTHIFLHADKERFHSHQMRDESPVERIVRATNHARAALLAGYTTYRDLGTEALGSADANLRDCINRGLTPGPRLFVATEALASSGSYEVRTENRLARDSAVLGLSLPRASDAADGVWGVRAAVRRRIGEGADVVKFYADYRRRVMRFPPDAEGPGGRLLFPPDRRDRNPASALFSQAEMDAIVDEARLADVPVAAHAAETSTALMATRAGVATVEHVFVDTAGCRDEMLAEMERRGTIWVPTLSTAEDGFDAAKFERCKAAVKEAFDRGVRLAAGGDTGVTNHGLNCREMEIMMEAGIPIEDVLVAGTYAGWHACGGDASGFRFGWWDEGNRADIVALDADPREDPKALRKVSFVMKDGRVWKRNGRPVDDMILVTQWPQEEEYAEKESREQVEQEEGVEDEEGGPFKKPVNVPFASASCVAESAAAAPSSAAAFGVGPNPAVLSITRSSGNPTPAASDVGWETDSFDVNLV
ncbi:hypothetical protein C7999DRAFT_28500 [Corynascus novoguineensis]|uniref:Amidohydrolase-related domain-containing protein n=1 Tax=Corynascus novoguineensis TaxID=1126955 RepID=A0AAN7HTK4_9PEZI|nr:hypothetical protein C7999DRAFT_28500 [Corynascus novoguineensis]